MTVDELALNDEAFLRQVRVSAFEAQPELLEPLGSSNLTWDVTVPQHRPPIKLQLRGGGLAMAVGGSGSRIVAPVFSTEYSLVASLPRASRVVGRQPVQVDTTGCLEQSYDEAMLSSELSTAVDEVLADHSELRRRRDDATEIRPDGAHFAIRLHALINDAPNPDIDVDGTFQFRASGGRLTHQLTRFSLDIDFSWWRDALILSFMPAWLAAALAESNQQALMRREILNQLDEVVARANLTAATLGYQFLYVMPRTDCFLATLCPLSDAQGPAGPGRPTGPAPGAPPDTAPIDPR